MDPNSGRIYQQLLADGEQSETDEQIRARGHVPIAEGKLREVLAMSLEQRKDWARKWEEAQALLNIHPAARVDGETDEEARKAKNERKRQRKERK